MMRRQGRCPGSFLQSEYLDNGRQDPPRASLRVEYLDDGKRGSSQEFPSSGIKQTPQKHTDSNSTLAQGRAVGMTERGV